MAKNYFSRREHTCKCGCGLYNMDSLHMFMLNQARDLAGIPFIVLSGSRCEKHNKAEGGKEESSHLVGFGSDIAAENDEKRFIILRALVIVGFSRIGIGKSFIHVDNDPTKNRKRLWLY